MSYILQENNYLACDPHDLAKPLQLRNNAQALKKDDKWKHMDLYVRTWFEVTPPYGDIIGECPW